MGELKYYTPPNRPVDVSSETIINEPEFGDGDGGGSDQYVEEINIQMVLNGVILRFILDDGQELTEVYNSLSEALDRIKETVGETYEE